MWGSPHAKSLRRPEDGRAEEPLQGARGRARGGEGNCRVHILDPARVVSFCSVGVLSEQLDCKM